MIRLLDQSNHSNGFSEDDADSVRKESIIDCSKNFGVDGPDETDFPHRSLGKSKSVDDADRRKLSTRSGSKRAHFLRKGRGRTDALTVQSDTVYLPSLSKNNGDGKTMTSLQEDSQKTIYDTGETTKHSILEDESSVPECGSKSPQYLDESHAQVSVDLDMSEDDTIDASSFANDSLPSSFRLSTSNFSLPSDLTGSTNFKDASFASFASPSKNGIVRVAVTRSSTATIGCSTADSTPLPPRRQSSDRSSLGKIDVIREVPFQIDCLPTDSSPKKPSRQSSIRQLPTGEESLGASFVSSLSIDTSPKKPTRQNSRAHLFRGIHKLAIALPPIPSNMSTDSSPNKPLRRKSLRDMCSQSGSPERARSCVDCTPAREFAPFERKKVSRSESCVQPASRPTLTRREALVRRQVPSQRIRRLSDHASIQEETMQELRSDF